MENHIDYLYSKLQNCLTSRIDSTSRTLEFKESFNECENTHGLEIRKDFLLPIIKRFQYAGYIHEEALVSKVEDSFLSAGGHGYNVSQCKNQYLITKIALLTIKTMSFVMMCGLTLFLKTRL